MGRPKEYLRSELLDKAVEVFRRQGFNGTSTAELVAELGVNRKSMYAEFGSKQELFEAALGHYHGKHLTRVLARIEAPDAGIDEVQKAFHGYASASEGKYRGLGCLMCNTAVERAALDAGSGQFVSAYFARFTLAFRNALDHAKQLGDIKQSVDTDEIAGFLTTLMVGISACIRGEAPVAQVWAAHAVVKQTLDNLRA